MASDNMTWQHAHAWNVGYCRAPRFISRASFSKFLDLCRGSIRSRWRWWYPLEYWTYFKGATRTSSGE